VFSPQSIVYAWDNQLHYALALLEDVTDEQFVLRPGGNMNHPAWIIGHVSLYHGAATALLNGEPMTDPKDDPLFGFEGRGPLEELAPYGSKQAMLDRFATGHERVAQTLLSAKPGDFQRKPSLPRWAAQYPTVEFMLPDLLILHESMHIGQISMWRRAVGLAKIQLPDRTPRPGLIAAE
jgi:hypothetical protein